MTISVEDIEEALKEKPLINVAEKLPEIYHDFLSVFSREEAEKLPPQRSCDHEIKLRPGTEPPWGPLYNMSRGELEVLKKYLKDNLERGFIRPSISPASSPVLFVKKPGGGLRFCVDYRALNDITIKNRYPIPRIHETLTVLGSAKFFMHFGLDMDSSNIKLCLLVWLTHLVPSKILSMILLKGILMNFARLT